MPLLMDRVSPDHRSIQRVLFLCLALITVASCASHESHNRMGVLVVAATESTVFVGRAHTLGTRGTFTMTSLDDSDIHCSGTFRYHFSDRGRANYTCSDEQTGQLQIKASGYLSGTGEGNSDLGPVQLVFGYPLKQVNRMLSLPGGSELVWSGQDILLVEQR